MHAEIGSGTQGDAVGLVCGRGRQEPALAMGKLEQQAGDSGPTHQ